jgi:pyruvate formate lyase activating enzyme
MQRIYWKTRCIGCGACVKVCPIGKGCQLPGCVVCENQCGLCVDVCPTGALKGTAKWYTVEDLAEVVRQDSRFYYRSGGGVTFSGGESLVQWKFVREAARCFKTMLIHNAIETCGFASWERLWAAVEYIDLVLFDIKHLDTDIHRKYTGQGNELILDNLRKLAAREKEVIIRIPVIKDLNDSREHMSRLLDLVGQTRVKEIHLLPYHALGKPKNEGLGRDFHQFARPDDETLDGLVKQIATAGIKALVGG